MRSVRHIKKDIFNIAVIGIYSPINTKYYREVEVKKILLEELGSVANITLSRDVAQIGLLERENTSNSECSYFATCKENYCRV